MDRSTLVYIYIYISATAPARTAFLSFSPPSSLLLLLGLGPLGGLCVKHILYDSSVSLSLSVSVSGGVVPLFSLSGVAVAVSVSLSGVVVSLARGVRSF